MKHILVFCVAWLVLTVGADRLFAQAPANVRYVCNNDDEVTDDQGVSLGYHVKGRYENDGRSWANAKENVQEAINDLVNNGLTGEVWVASGTYLPTESTESNGGSALNMSFKIPAGIVVRGGFRGKLVTVRDGDVVRFAGETNSQPYDVSSNPNGRLMTPANPAGALPQNYMLTTTLSGNVSQHAPTFVWNNTRQQFNTQFFGNSYHVVWFATRGFDANGHANPLADDATLNAHGGTVAAIEGFTITGGNARNTSLEGHPHNAYGGGIYMVSGARVERCIITNCEASRDGGGIYMDGGGQVESTAIVNCQALGTSLNNGFGGAICIEENKQVVPTVIRAIGIVNCVARYGGGIATRVNNPNYNVSTPEKLVQMRYNIGMGSILIANCTATTEGGGLYLWQGGACTQMTIVNNRCNGTGVQVNGMKSGAGAGVYIRDYGILANSIVWNNQSAASSNPARSAQFALSRSSVSNRPQVLYSALSNVDYVDWSGVYKDNVVKLSRYNNLSAETAAGVSHLESEGFVSFIQPSAVVGYEADAPRKMKLGYDGASLLEGYNYRVTYGSSVTNRGVLTSDLDVQKQTPTPLLMFDLHNEEFTPNPTLGAFKSASPGFMYSVEDTGESEQHDVEGVPTTFRLGIAHLYVDPEAVYTDDEQAAGFSWANPYRSLNDALYICDSRLVESLHDPERQVSPFTITKVVVHVKAGVTGVSGSQTQGTVRNTTLRIPDLTYTPVWGGTRTVPLEILGGYDRSLTYTGAGYDPRVPSQLTATYMSEHDLSSRNPMLTPTIITGDNMGDYRFSIPHIFKLDGCQHVTIDGFQVRNANASTTVLENHVTVGAAFTVNNSSDICLRNIEVAGCTATNGAVVYATRSTINFENCIFHNNATTYTETSGNIYCDAQSALNFEHCDVLKNVGYPFYNIATGVGKGITMHNSIVYANMSVPVDDTRNAGVAHVGTNPNDRSLVAFKGTGNYSGHTNLFDLKSKNLSPMDAMHIEPWLDFERNDDTSLSYPNFYNPTKNAGVSPDGDATYYGRGVSFQPRSGNPMVNSAFYTGNHTTWGTDYAGNPRSYGGLPDIGAVENHYATSATEGEYAYDDGLPAFGAVLYVRDFRHEDRTIDYVSGADGSSWENAINGNAYYYSDGTHGEVRDKMVPDGTQNWVSGHNKMNQVYDFTRTGGVYLRSGHTYLTLNGNTVGTTTNLEEATLFVFEKVGDYYYIKSGSNYLKYNSSSKNYSYVIEGNTKNNSKWIVSSDRDTYIKGSAHNRYITTGSTLSSSANTTWSFFEKVYDAGGYYEDNLVAYPGLNGLQYAVNMAEQAYAADVNPNKVAREIWVSAGIYSKDPETGDESCFMIRDGVHVYGAFPKTGTPSKAMRQPLLSQYVKNNSDYSYDDYETILQPITQTIADDVARRVLGQSYDYNPRKADYRSFTTAVWDGFTLRKGMLDVATINGGNPKPAGRQGGGGAAFYKNVTLRNVVVTNNTVIYKDAVANQDFRAGGIYMDGGTLESCYIINNTLQGWSNGAKAKSGAAYGGGMYMYSGTVFNSVIANNYIYAAYSDGAGVFLENANFFNNTIVNNKAEGTSRASGGVAIWTDVSKQTSTLNVFNSIIANNEGKVGGKIGDKNVYIGNGGIINLYNCLSEDITNKVNGSNKITFNNCIAKTGEELRNVFVDLGAFNSDMQDFVNRDLRLRSGSVAINAGIDNPTINSVTYDLSTYTDMDFSDRIKDCTIDIGAYEFNDAYAITPQVSGNQAIFYVAPGGFGNASGSSPANAACADKMQKVIDAAGRYKYLNPAKQVIVKVANSKSMQETGSDFTYYPDRTTDYNDQDIRLYSIIIPRGVEVWGGYTDVPMKLDGEGNVVKDTEHTWSDTYNGFYSGAADLRDILGNPTYFDAAYTNKSEGTDAIAYHVVTFSDRIYDGSGMPYVNNGPGHDDTDNMTGSSHYQQGTIDDENTFLSMSVKTQDRAVIDGVFIKGGKANLAMASTSDRENINRYGGAAIVTEFAHVRNCIAQGNMAIYGGAFALKHGALISGTLMDQNTADYGGALYVFEDQTRLSDGTQINTGTTATTADAMPHVYTSTIANNTATRQGGGLWFSDSYPNVRLNSTVLWKNQCNEEANVYGNYAPEKPVEDHSSVERFFPFAYSAVENIRMTGTNNIRLETDNNRGARFARMGSLDGKTLANDDLSDIGFYDLSNYSVLLRSGMPVNDFDLLVTNKKIAATDFTLTDRKIGENRSYIDIGAHAQEKIASNNLLMLRLFVAQTEDLDVDALMEMMHLDPSTGTDAEKELKQYYSQEGSSFAYPFQNLQDALDYIRDQRSGIEVSSGGKAITNDAINLPFEIFVARGTYYPTEDISGSHGQTLGNTFAIPEGVSIYGGFSVSSLGANKFYGRGNHRASSFATRTDGSDATPFWIEGNVEREAQVEVTIPGTSYRIAQSDWRTMCDAREHADVNANSIIEPWEFTNQTILNGDVMNSVSDGVYHVVTIVPDQNSVGMLPCPSIDRSAAFVADGYHVYEEGQPIVLNGLRIEGGRAANYHDDMLDEFSKYGYYHGGGLLADGNRYCDDYNKHARGVAVYKNSEGRNAVGYRNIPMSIVNCHFFDNQAGHGGAISTNMYVDIFGSAFESNLAYDKSEEVTVGAETITVRYPGQGGAVYTTYQMTAINTLFANNEARDSRYDVAPQLFPTARNPHPTVSILGGAGGAIYNGLAGQFHLVNCNVVRNMANLYPAVFTMNPNKYGAAEDASLCTTADYSQFVNTVAWGNELNPSMVGKLTDRQRFAAQLICNYGRTDRNEAYQPALEGSNIPSNQAELDGSNWMEVAWFSAYEPGRGITPNNTYDLRDFDFSPIIHAQKQLSNLDRTDMSYNLVAAEKYPYQNCNVEISSDNGNLEGPNFVRPSVAAGINGYNQSSDWSPSRLNKMTDAGSGKIEQRMSGHNLVFATWYDLGENHPVRAYSNETDNDYKTLGAYTALRYLAKKPNYNQFLPLGDDWYMKGVGTDKRIHRIAVDPNPTHYQTYIDIGVYEYEHIPLNPTTVPGADQVDVLWVSAVELPENGDPDGSSWERPTSDLQRAIETLLASRNGHRKEVRLMDGVYMPMYAVNDRLSYIIDTKAVNSSALVSAGDPVGLGVMSLTIKGGYSHELNGQHDTELYPTILRAKERTRADGAKWDYLFDIKDATQRYGASDYTAGNQYGWDLDHHASVSTIPIEFDGITFVNDQTRVGVKGSAIYYADQTFNASYEREDNATAYVATRPGSVNITTVVGDEITGVGHTYSSESNPAKLVMSRCMVVGSGPSNQSSDATGSAIYVGRKGGSALLYNNVFHSNYAKPLVGYDMKCVNNTFALNYEAADLLNDTETSKIFNSVFWRNHPTNSRRPDDNEALFGSQFALAGLTLDDASLTTCGSIFANNAYTGGSNASIDYDDPSGYIQTHNRNVGLVNQNTDAFYGPNFEDPFAANLLERSFKIKPSMRLLNRGDNNLYSVFDYAWSPSTDRDCASKTRNNSLIIDLGALEYQNMQNRVIYVDPSWAVSGTGLSWGSPLGYGNLQAAVDLAAVFYKSHNKEAYVFIKASSSSNREQHTGEVLTLRDGVTVFGSVDSDFRENCPYHLEQDGSYRYVDDEISNFVAHLLVDGRMGVLNPTAGHTRILGIRTDQAAFTQCDGNGDGPASVIDGFEVTNRWADNATGVVTAPVIDIKPYIGEGILAQGNMKIALRNIAVHDNDLSDLVGENNLVNIDNAVLYESLMHTNKVNGSSSVLKVGQHGYVMSATVEGKTTGADASVSLNNVSGGNAVSENTAASHVYNSLTNFGSDARILHTFSGYNYHMEDNNLNFQLTEMSPYIDAIDHTQAGNNQQLLPVELREFVKFASVASGTRFSSVWSSVTKDLMGNLRLQTLGNMFSDAHGSDSYTPKLDRGAFETWKVERDMECVYPDYPHVGSVVYVMSGKNLVIDPLDGADPRATAFYPGFLLLQEGASVYGNGRPIQASYVAMERKLNREGTVISMPFKMDYKSASKTYANGTTSLGVGIPSYDGNGVLTLSREDARGVYTYNGARRSSSDYSFASQSSPCWESCVSGTAVTAAQGVLYVPNSSYENATVRFTARGADLTDYIYSENSTPGSAGDRHTYKELTLFRFDDDDSTEGAADFTEADDRGWNCVGLPYLVNGYATMDNVTATDAVHGTTAQGRMMHKPHALWLYYDGAHYPDGTDANGSAGFYSVSSWSTSDWHVATGEEKIWAGEGFFVQNQMFSGDEALRFYRPVPPVVSALAPGYRGTHGRYMMADLDEELKPSVQLSMSGRNLKLSGLENGEHAFVFGIAGRLVAEGVAQEGEFWCELPEAGVYLIRLSNVSYKVIAQ